MRITLLFIFFVFGISAFAQNSESKDAVHINGHVTYGLNALDSMKVTMAIFGEETILTTYTDTTGWYEFINPDLVPGEDTVLLYVAGQNTVYGTIVIRKKRIINSYQITADFIVAHNSPNNTCIAAFGFNYVSGNVVQFINLSYDTDSTNYYWNFGDGNYSIEKHPLHTYNANGEYNVWLSMEHEECYDSWTEEVEIDQPPMFSGQILYDGSHETEFIVRLIPLSDPKSNWYNGVVDDNGYFSFIEVPTDNYIIEAIPTNMYTYIYPKPIPTYYPNNLYWSEANIAQPNGEHAIELITSSFIHSGANNIECTINDADYLLDNRPTVILMNENYEPLTVSTIFSGLNYSIIDLQEGTYYIYPQYAGKGTIPQQVTFDNSSEPTQYIEFEVTETHIAPPGMSIDEVSQGFSIYPNPTKAVLNIEVDDRITHLDIIDMDGKIVLNDIEPFDRLKTIEIQDLESGTYILRLYNGKNIRAQIFSKK